jgi:hypothetical protein
MIDERQSIHAVMTAWAGREAFDEFVGFEAGPRA